MSLIPVLHNSVPSNSHFLPDISKQRVESDGGIGVIIPCSGRQQWLLKIECQRSGSSLLIFDRKKRVLTRLLLAEALHTRDGSHGDCRGGGSVLSREMKKSHLGSHTQ